MQVMFTILKVPSEKFNTIPFRVNDHTSIQVFLFENKISDSDACLNYDVHGNVASASNFWHGLEYHQARHPSLIPTRCKQYNFSPSVSFGRIIQRSNIVFKEEEKATVENCFRERVGG